MQFSINPDIHMWVVLAITAATIVSYALERLSLEVTSLIMLVGLLVFFSVFPLTDATGEVLIQPADLLAGFGNPSLIAVLSLLVMGQAMVQTEALQPLAYAFLNVNRSRPMVGVALALLFVMAVSGVLNNTPVVVMFIPILLAMADRLNWSPSSLMMPLSFIAVLGGSLTLIGSSTNLFVSSTLVKADEPALGFFSFTVPGLVLAAVGAVYVIFLLPRLLPDRRTLAGALFGEGRQFIAELDVSPGSPLIGAKPVAGHFPQLPDMTVRLIQRRGQNILPPFEDVVLQENDVLIVAATRQNLKDFLAKNQGYFVSRRHSPSDPSETGGSLNRSAGNQEREAGRRESGERSGQGERVLAEVMIAPASRLAERTLEQAAFRQRYGVMVLGIQRRARMVRQRMGSIRLEPGDVLLVLGEENDIERLRNERDVLPMAWSTSTLPTPQRKHHALVIFIAVFLSAATGLVPIAVAAPTGAVATILTGCLNIRQATRAVDRKIYVLVAATLGLGTALQQTGGASFVAHSLMDLLNDPAPWLVTSLFYLLVAVASNVLTNNACAILFSPIAINLAYDLGVEPKFMAITVVLAANASFVTPIGYQTNLLVMAPGHYTFRDFIRGGLPLLVLLWLVFTLFFPTWAGFGFSFGGD